MSKGIIFSGQGAQKVGMGQSLFEGSPTAKALYEKADEVLGWKLSEISFNGPEETLTETRVCQPALYVHGFTVYTLLEEAGKTGDISLAAGLSLGELTALAAAGSFSFEDGLRVVAERGRLMQEACDATDGAMASMIGGEVEAVKELCAAHDVDMANLNCPGQIVISGETAKVGQAVEAAKAAGTFRMVVPLKVAGAYHSRLMEPARVKFEEFLQGVEIKEPQLTVLSNTTGKAVKTAAEIREALAKQVVSSVLWEDCMREAASMGVTDFYECGLGAVLAGMAKRTDRSWIVKSIAEFADLG
ncbi:ACP S-malonyltransferase [Puniceicoccales bacterium CK1056]|uniref:Malonyl CoA-acyl carrier protein transacylase n=1 Tax=Oceanipulchritudo coccoides TaxID=2706888 RepID=A0A6B2LYU6_9BACT|nr:ACP S-malonyltransferase [Oceanipulchritudo coccoides]NDV61861.1 ACP S-malonyltransferase [Oceanipulchritudo coccoides]